MSASQTGFARNGSLFREVNERIAEVSRAYDRLELLCECGRERCLEPIAVTRADYERVRTEPHLFMLTPGHEKPEIERVVEQRDGWVIVEKTGEAGDAAEKLELRS